MEEYKRLTIRLRNGKIDCLQEYSNKDLINRLAELEDKIEQSELVKIKTIAKIMERILDTK